MATFTQRNFSHQHFCCGSAFLLLLLLLRFTVNWPSKRKQGRAAFTLKTLKLSSTTVTSEAVRSCVRVLARAVATFIPCNLLFCGKSGLPCTLQWYYSVVMQGCKVKTFLFSVAFSRKSGLNASPWYSVFHRTPESPSTPSGLLAPDSSLRWTRTPSNLLCRWWAAGPWLPVAWLPKSRARRGPRSPPLGQGGSNPSLAEQYKVFKFTLQAAYYLITDLLLGIRQTP